MGETLIERLRRGRLAYTTQASTVYEGPTLQDMEAADALTANARTIASLTAERDEKQAALQKIADEHLPYVEQLEALTATLNERIAVLEKDGAAFIDAVDALCDWLNNSELSSDHADEKPDDFQRLCAAMDAFRAALGDSQ